LTGPRRGRRDSTTKIPGGDKPVTVRLSEEQLQLLSGLCIVDDTTLAEQLRAAVVAYIDGRRRSPDLLPQVAEAKQRQLAALEALAREEGTEGAEKAQVEEPE
jgi:hypothetical protein